MNAYMHVLNIYLRYNIYIYLTYILFMVHWTTRLTISTASLPCAISVSASGMFSSYHLPCNLLSHILRDRRDGATGSVQGTFRPADWDNFEVKKGSCNRCMWHPEAAAGLAKMVFTHAVTMSTEHLIVMRSHSRVLLSHVSQQSMPAILGNCTSHGRGHCMCDGTRIDDTWKGTLTGHVTHVRCGMTPWHLCQEPNLTKQVS